MTLLALVWPPPPQQTKYEIEKLLDQCVDCGERSSIRHTIINVLLILL